MKKRILPILLALIMALTLLPTLAMADETVYIDSDEDLVSAIKDQADGQTWVFTEAGEYDAKNTEEDSNGFYATSKIADGSNFVFPIYVDNLTITKEDGIGEVVITSSARPDAQTAACGISRTSLPSLEATSLSKMSASRATPMIGMTVSATRP